MGRRDAELAFHGMKATYPQRYCALGAFAVAFTMAVGSVATQQPEALAESTP